MRNKKKIEKKYRTIGIRFRTAFLCWLVTLATLGVFVSMLIPHQRKAFIEDIQSQSFQLVSPLITAGQLGSPEETMDFIEKHCREEMAQNGTILYFIITNPEGASTRVSLEGKQPTSSAVDSLVAGEADLVWSDLVGARVFNYAFPISIQTGERIWIQVGLSSARFQRTVHDLYRVTAFAGLLALLGGLFMSFFYSRMIVGPILKVEHAVQSVTQGDFTIRAQVHSGDEVEVLAESFNLMTETLEQTHLELSRAIDSAESASRSKSRFLANMSHELRTPMNGVIGSLQLLRDTTIDNDQDEYIDTAITSAQSLLSLISDILDFSKIEAGKLELQPVSFKPQDVLEEVVMIVGVRAREKGITISCNLQENVHETLFGDDLRLRQVLLNLADNAVKFTEKGEVRIHARIEEANPSDLMLRFEVSDTGIGMDKDQQVRIFEAFTQADGSMTRQYGGTGLGLSICQQLVTLMGGNLGVESQVGQGSTFWFCVPFEKEAPITINGEELSILEDVSKEEDPQAVERKRILLVEDNELNLVLTSKMLEQRNFDCVCAHDGEEAVQLVQEGGFDLILMDCQMPVMHGYEASKCIRDIENKSGGLGPRGSRIPIVALTAHATQGDREKCLLAGMNDYLTKPLDFKLFDAVMRAQLYGEESGKTQLPALQVSDTESPIFDFNSFYEQLGKDTDLIRRILVEFNAQATRDIDGLSLASKAGDTHDLAQIAHRLKGSSANVFANGLKHKAGRLEDLARNGRLAGVPLTIIKLKDELNKFQNMVSGSLDQEDRDAALATPSQPIALTDDDENHPKILVVDDDTTTRMLARESLGKQGFTVIEAGEGMHALELFEGTRPDAVLLDVVLPGIDGFEVCRRIRGLSGGEDVPVLMMTAYQDLNSIERAYAAGATEFASKPLNWAIEGHRLQYMLRAATSVANVNRARKEWERTFHSMDDIVTLLSPDLRITRANHAAGASINKDESELIGKHCFEVFQGRSSPCEQCPVLRAFEKQQPMAEEIEYASTGQICLVSASPIFEEGGKISGIVHIAKDLTERKQIEAEFLHAQKMEAIGTLAGGIAHDFNNLLQAILGYGEMLAISLKDDQVLSGEVREIVEAAERGHDLTRQLLTASRKMRSHRQAMSLNDEVDSIRKLLGRSLPKMVEIETKLEPDMATVHADPGQIGQVLMNLAVNAGQSMPKGGRLILETKNVTLDEAYCTLHEGATPGEYVQLSVSDTGHGIDRETMEHIFEPFFTTKRPTKGTGLGLAVVYGIVKNHDGYIMCYSEPGIGTTFKVYLPKYGQPLPLVEEPQDLTLRQHNFPATRLTVLLADDEPSIRRLGEQLLTGAGYQVLLAKDGQEAVELFEAGQDQIDMVVLDLVMPRLGGIKCLDKLRTMRPDLKAILASGFSFEVCASDVEAIENCIFIQKPYRGDELLDSIKDAISENQSSGCAEEVSKKAS